MGDFLIGFVLGMFVIVAFLAWLFRDFKIWR